MKTALTTDYKALSDSIAQYILDTHEMTPIHVIEQIIKDAGVRFTDHNGIVAACIRGLMSGGSSIMANVYETADKDMAVDADDCDMTCRQYRRACNDQTWDELCDEIENVQTFFTRV